MKTINIFILIAISIITNSCKYFIFRDVECRDFELHDFLDWYPGEINENYSFTNNNYKNDNLFWSFTIENKEIHHREKYVSDTGCGCEDILLINLTNEDGDVIYMETSALYTEQNEANIHFYLGITKNKKTSVFYEDDISHVGNYKIKNLDYQDVITVENRTNPNNEFIKVVIAPKYGILEITDANLTIWTKSYSNYKLNWDINSFDYITTECE